MQPGRCHPFWPRRGRGYVRTGTGTAVRAYAVFCCPHGVAVVCWSVMTCMHACSQLTAGDFSDLAVADAGCDVERYCGVIAQDPDLTGVRGIGSTGS